MRLVVFPLVIAFFPLALHQVARHDRAPSPCDEGNGGLTLAPGFCAVVVAKDLDGVRQVTVGSDGIVYGALAKGDAGAVALRTPMVTAAPTSAGCSGPRAPMT